MQQPVPFFLRNAENTYNFFTSMEASNISFTIAYIAQYTGYRASVVERYLRMKWRKWFIEPVGNGNYRCTRAIYDHDKTFFIRTLSQGIFFPDVPVPTFAVDLDMGVLGIEIDVSDSKRA
jgi:hypothetical protein